jgi:hypothetical protein
VSGNKSVRLPNSAITSYNGVQLSEYTSTKRVTVRPKLDSSGRVTIYNEYSFVFETWFGDSQTDAEVQEIRRKLTEPGKPFQFNGRGFTPIAINLSRSGPQDCIWGPFTQEIEFDLFHPNATRRMVWSFVAHISDCKGSRFALSGRVVEYNTEFTHTPTKEGLVRTITGHVVIPNFRGGLEGRQALDTADGWREKVLPPMLPRFDREFDFFRLSEDRSRLEWSVTDTEFGLNPPPKYVVEPPDLNHEIKPAGGAGGLSAWVGECTGTYRLAKTCPDRYWPVKHFFGEFVRDRVGAQALEMLKNPVPDAKAATIVPVWVGLKDVNIAGPLRTYQMSFVWTFATRLENLLKYTPMWRPVPGSDWKEWQASLSGSLLNPYGTTQVRFRTNDDRITDLCDPGSLHAGDVVKIVGESILRTARDVALEALADVIPTPKPENSFLSYVQQLYAEIDGGLVPVTTLPEKKPPPEPKFGAMAAVVGAPILAADGKVAAVPGGKGGSLDNQQQARGKLENQRNDPQRRRKDVMYVWLIGSASRAAYPIGCPTLTDVNGARVVEMLRVDRGEGYKTWTGFNAGLFPVFHASWRLRYYLPDGLPVGPLPTPFNPLLDDSN